jgi:hypothetical protein
MQITTRGGRFGWTQNNQSHLATYIIVHLAQDNQLFTHRFYCGTCRDTRDARVVKDPAAFGHPPDSTAIIDEEQTVATAPLGDDPTSFNTTKVTFHHL